MPTTFMMEHDPQNHPSVACLDLVDIDNLFFLLFLVCRIPGALLHVVMTGRNANLESEYRPFNLANCRRTEDEEDNAEHTEALKTHMFARAKEFLLKCGVSSDMLSKVSFYDGKVCDDTVVSHHVHAREWIDPKTMPHILGCDPTHMDYAVTPTQYDDAIKVLNALSPEERGQRSLEAIQRTTPPDDSMMPTQDLEDLAKKLVKDNMPVKCYFAGPVCLGGLPAMFGKRPELKHLSWSFVGQFCAWNVEGNLFGDQFNKVSACEGFKWLVRMVKENPTNFMLHMFPTETCKNEMTVPMEEWMDEKMPWPVRQASALWSHCLGGARALTCFDAILTFHLLLSPEECKNFVFVPVHFKDEWTMQRVTSGMENTNNHNIFGAAEGTAFGPGELVKTLIKALHDIGNSLGSQSPRLFSNALTHASGV